MAPHKDERYIAIRDTKEKENHGWVFASSQSCSGTQDKHLETGDYSLLGYEDILCIERKGAITELAHNLIEERFYRELDRMQEYKYAFLILEFSIEDLMDYPESVDLPYKIKRKIKMTGKVLLCKLMEIQLKYNIKILFCNTRSKEVVSSIFRRVIESVKRDKKKQQVKS